MRRDETFASVLVAEVPPDRFGGTYASAILNHASEVVQVNTHRKVETARRVGRRKAARYGLLLADKTLP